MKADDGRRTMGWMYPAKPYLLRISYLVPRTSRLVSHPYGIMRQEAPMTVVADANELRKITLFRDLAPAELAHLNTLLHSRTVPASTHLLSMDQPGERVYFIYEGTVKV